MCTVKLGVAGAEPQPLFGFQNIIASWTDTAVRLGSWRQSKPLSVARSMRRFSGPESGYFQIRARCRLCQNWKSRTVLEVSKVWGVGTGCASVFPQSPVHSQHQASRTGSGCGFLTSQVPLQGHSLKCTHRTPHQLLQASRHVVIPINKPMK